jgi:hypothetical protein
MINKYIDMSKDFAECSIEYCNLLDSYEKFDRIIFLINVHRILSKLYFLGSRLPIYEEYSSDKTEMDNKTGSMSFYHTKLNDLRSYLNGMNDYFHIYNPIEMKNLDPIHYDISGDLSEIYDDLMSNIPNWSSGDKNIKADALWNWQFSWVQHWGKHALSALKAMHWYIEEYFVNNLDNEIDIRNASLL